MRPLRDIHLIRTQLLAVGELFGGVTQPGCARLLAVGELFGGVTQPGFAQLLAVGELFGGVTGTSVLLEELVEFGGG